MFVVDASVWVSRYIVPDANHAASCQWLNQVLDQQVALIAPALLLPEVTGPLSRVASELDARRALSQILDLLQVHIVPLGHDRARLAAQLSAQFRLRGADSVYVALARELGLPLVTWDREQRERATTVVTVLTPAELMAAP